MARAAIRFRLIQPQPLGNITGIGRSLRALCGCRLILSIDAGRTDTGDDAGRHDDTKPSHLE